MDLLRPVNRRLRRASTISLFTVAAIAGSLTIGLCADMFERRSLHYEGKPIWIAVIIIGALAISAGWIGWRLSREKISANGVTVIPAWFIQLFAVLFLVGDVFVAFKTKQPLLLVALIVCVPAIAAMIYIPWKRRS